MKPVTFLLAAITALLAGCAASPSVTYRYHLTDWKTTVTVIQTLGCSATGDYLVTLSDPTVETEYFSDPRHDGTIQLSKINSRFADSNFKIDYMSDGRLMGINQSTAGQGGAIATAAITTLAAFSQVALANFYSRQLGIDTATSPVAAAAPPPAHGTPPTRPAHLNLCKEIANVGNDKPISILYKHVLNAGDLSTEDPIKIEVDSKYSGLRKHLASAGTIPAFWLHLIDITRDNAAPTWDDTQTQRRRSPQTLEVQDMAAVTLMITQTGGDADDGVKMTTVLIPLASTHELPIPKARLFGGQTFTVAMDNSGRIKSSGYQHTNGVAGVVDAIQKAIDTQTPASKAAALEAQADLMAQQRRRVICITDPANCE